MLAFILRRLVQSIVVMGVVALISFMLFRYVGDPVASLVGQESRLSDIADLRERLGLNDPFYVQFARFIGNAVQGEFGISYRLQQPVSELILSRLPATIELAFTSAYQTTAPVRCACNGVSISSNVGISSTAVSFNQP